MSRSIESYYKSNNPADAVLSLRNFCSDFGEMSSGNDRARQVSQLQIISARCSALAHVAAGDSPAKRAQARGPSPGRRVACRYVSILPESLPFHPSLAFQLSYRLNRVRPRWNFIHRFPADPSRVLCIFLLGIL